MPSSSVWPREARWPRRRPAKDGPQNSAVNSQQFFEPDRSTGPVKGPNSFTEGEAKSRIEKKGFANVSALKKDDNGVWRGRAMKNGQQVDVALDYQGNVFQGERRPGQRADERPKWTTPGTGGR